MLINLTNHPSTNWSPEQRDEALRRWGGIEDVSFPSVGAQWDDADMKRCAGAIADEVAAKMPDAVLCQGEMSMTFLLVAMFQRRGIPVYAATSERRACEELMPDGTVRKTVLFSFVQFRKYTDLSEI